MVRRLLCRWRGHRWPDDAKYHADLGLAPARCLRCDEPAPASWGRRVVSLRYEAARRSAREADERLRAFVGGGAA